jgi:carbamoyltransferase
LNILGISCFYHDSAAVLIVDDKIISAVQEEVFTRIKHDNSFPTNSINYCLDQSKLKLEDIDAIAFYDKPLLKFERILEMHLEMAPKGLVSFISSMPVWMKEKLFFKKLLKKNLKNLGKIKSNEIFFFPEHHLSHAASTFYPSHFDEAAILTLDGVGEWATTSISIGSGSSISVLKEINFPHSIGLLYSAFTSYLGFKVNSGEYKLMGLAPYGNADSERTKTYISKIKTHLVSMKKDGSFQLNLDYFKFTYSNRTYNARKWFKLFGIRKRKEHDDLTQEYFDLAFAIQNITEELILCLVKSVKKITKMDNLCLSGGVALNCVANGVIQRAGIFKGIYIQPAAGDSGGALGAALAVKNIFFFKKSSADEFTVFSGPEFSNKEIEKELDILKAEYEKSFDIAKDVAKIVKDQKVVGWFQGKMEFGPRALGNRSILGDPKNPEMKSIINQKIKFRESFRPFAPAVILSDVSKYFNFNGESPYMMFVHKVKTAQKNIELNNVNAGNELKKNDFPSITHIDGSARIQTVSNQDNSKFYDLLNNFKNISGYGMLINTSFNVRGEPMVCSPYDAYRCFMETNLDVLAIGDFLLYKEDQPSWNRGVKKFKLD